MVAKPNYFTEQARLLKVTLSAHLHGRNWRQSGHIPFTFIVGVVSACYICSFKHPVTDDIYYKFPAA